MALAGDAQGVEMRLPISDVGDRRMGLRLQAAQRLLGQMLLAQVGQGVRVERISDVAGVQQLQEVDPALAPGAGKPRKPVVADR